MRAGSDMAPRTIAVFGNMLKRNMVIALAYLLRTGGTIPFHTIQKDICFCTGTRVCVNNRVEYNVLRLSILPLSRWACGYRRSG